MCRQTRSAVEMLCVLACLAVSGSAHAQDGDEPFGGVVSGFTAGERLAGRQLTQARTATPKDDKPVEVTFFAAPSVVDTKGAFLSGVSAGLSRSGALPLQLKVSYRQISLDNSEINRDRAGVGVKQRLHGWKRVTLTAAVDYGNTQGRSQRVDGVAVADVALGENSPFNLTLNLGAATNRPKDGDGTSDAVGGIGLSFSKIAKGGTDIIEVGVDYSLKNDLDGEDDYSLTFSYVIKDHRATAVFGAGKHGVVFATALFRF